MATTPPPPARLKTPPTPRHGPKYDSHEPYSPRRSTRINAKRDANSSISDMTSLLHSQRASHFHPSSTPRALRKVTFPRTSSQTFSPPSSPLSPDTRQQRSGDNLRSKKSTSDHRHVKATRSSTEPDSETDLPGYLQPRGTKRRPIDMLPTPSKTPSKKHSHNSAQLGSTARALFIARPQTVEDAMPSPKKARLNKRHHGVTLESFAESDQGANDIEIYTDSVERIPDVDEADDNPFLVKKSKKLGPGKTAESAASKRTRKAQSGMTEEIDEAVKNDEGMVYVFRGKKFYRKFDNVNGHSPDEDADELGDSQVLHQAGASAHRPFTRSSITPRLLFPPKEPTPERLLDEEADTDIEAADPTSHSDDDEIVTPVKQQFKPITPPTTGHANGRKSQKLTPSSSPIASNPESSQSPSLRGSRSTLLDTWPRSKPGVRSISMKRDGESMEKSNGSSGKRARGSY